MPYDSPAVAPSGRRSNPRGSATFGSLNNDRGQPKACYERRWATLKGERESWLSHWRELGDFVLPRSGRWLSQDRTHGEKLNTRIVDPTATMALRTLTSGMMAGITSPARPWFRLSVPDQEMLEYAPVRFWLHDVERLLRQIFNKANIYNSLSSIYEELGLYGTAALVVEEDHDDIIRCTALTAGEYAVANSARLQVDTLYRELRMTVGQMVERFGEDNISEIAMSAWRRGEVDQWHDVVHVIEPRRERERGRIDGRNKPFKSVYYEKGGDPAKLLGESGYDEFPAMVPRWFLTGADAYGRSPGMDALGDVKSLMVLQKRMAQGVDKIVNPAMVGPGSLKNAVVNLLPGGVTYIDGPSAEAFRPAYAVNLRLGELQQLILEHQKRIERAFYADLFLVQIESDRRQMTATEVSARQEEKMLVLGPMLERLQAELLDPLIDRTFSIAVRLAIVPPPPPELQGMELRVEYISLLAQAQQAIATGSIERFSGFVGNLAAVNPAVLDKYDMDQALDEYGDALGVPPKIVRSDDDVKQIRDGRAKQEQAMQQAQAGMTAAQGAQVLSQTDTRSDNALTRMLGI
jgi:Bacteriophage head to tail connecting protein